MIHLNTNKILVPVDFSETSYRAIKHGAFIAQFLKGEVILTHIIRTSIYLDMILPVLHMEDLSGVTKLVQEKLEGFADEIRKEYGIKVSTIVSTGKVSSEVVNLAKESDAGIIVMGTQGYSAAEEFLLGSNAYRVISKSKIPVMTVRKNTDKLGYQNIVLPIDSSEHSRQKVNTTIEFAEKFSAKLHVIGVLGNDEKSYEPNMHTIVSQIAELAKAKDVSVDTKVCYANNRAHQTLKFAKTVHADLIVTMTDQNAEVSSLLLGTYAHQLINLSKAPVITFPPESHNEDVPFTFAGLELN